MQRERPKKNPSAQSAKLFSLLVLTGATLGATLATSLTLPACSSSTPDPNQDAGKEGGGGKFW